MPSEHAQSRSQTSPPTGSKAAHHRSTSSVQGDSAATSPSGGGTGTAAARPPKTPKHVVQHRTHTHPHTHSRVPSSKGAAKLSKNQVGQDHHGSHADLKKAAGRNASATNLIKKNHSNTALKRNRSSADIPRAPKSPRAKHSDETRAKGKKKFTSVQFELGDEQEEEEEGDEDADAAAGWEEASSTASPVLSRTVSRSGTTKLNANNGSAAASHRAQHPQSPSKKTGDEEPRANGSGGDTNIHTGVRTATDAKSITERLLQRVPSYHTATTKMSLATATPTTGGHTPSSSVVRTPQTGSKDDVVSRFVTGSGTPSDNSPFLPHTRHNNRDLQRAAAKEEVKRAQSMGNLTRSPTSNPQPHSDESDEERAILPRSRKSSTSTTPLTTNNNSAYHPPQQSRTQQKLWLQRASSNIEPAQMTPGAGAGLVGDGRDPRIRLQLEKTGLEYLVVRRYQDPVGQGLRRLETLPGMAAANERRIPKGSRRRSARGRGDGMVSAQGSYDGRRGGSLDEVDGRQEEGACVDAVLRALWEKNYDLSASE